MGYLQDGSNNGEFYKRDGSSANLIETLENISTGGGSADVSTITSILETSYTGDEIVTNDKIGREFKKGNAFVVGTVGSSVANGSQVALHVLTGDYPIFLTYSVSSTGLCDYGVVISPTILVAGTPTTIIHRNQQTLFLTDTLVYTNPTFAGDVAIPRFIGTAGNTNRATGGEKYEHSILMPAYSFFVIVAKNNSGNVIDRIGITADFLDIR